MLQATEYPYIPDIEAYNAQIKLIWYNMHSDIPVGQKTINSLGLHDLQDIFDTYINNPLFNCWHVRSRHARTLQKLLGHKFYLKQYSYFIEQSATHNTCIKSTNKSVATAKYQGKLRLVT